MSEKYEEKTSKTYWVKLFIAGDKQIITDCCRKSCFPKGLCVTVKNCDYIFAGGMEYGFEIGFIQYPKFQEDEKSILDKAVNLGKMICEKNYQWSFTIQDPVETRYFSRRENYS